MLYNSLLDAITAFYKIAPDIYYRDYHADHLYEASNGPWRVETYDNTVSKTNTCPPYEHDCFNEGCGQSWNTGGEIGVFLKDEKNKTLLDSGIILKMSIGI